MSDRHIPSDADITAARHEAEAALGSTALSDPALWEQPSTDLEDRIMAALAAEEERPTATATVVPLATKRRRRLTWLPAGIAAAVIALVAVAALRPDTPDWEVALGATDNAPGVTASVIGWNEPSGTRMELEIDGLAPAPAGFVYELWLSRGPVHVSAGTFHTPRDVTLWAGVGRADFPRLWITLEAIDDGDPGPGVNLLDTEA
jgi:hypothetical protein